MKIKIALVLSALVVAAVFVVAERAAGQGDSEEAQITGFAPHAEFETDMDKVSYAIGLDIGTNLKLQKLNLNPQILSRGIADAIAGREPLLSEEEMMAVMRQFEMEYMAQREAEMAEMAVENLAEAEEFLGQNRANVGVETTESGLQYIVIREGTGPTPTAQDVVRVHYTGTLIDGTEFDSSYRADEPAQFMVGGIIPGWQEALQKMKVGAKWRLFIPPDLAYGEQGVPSVIEPNSLLIFEVELLGIVDAPPPDAMPQW